MQRANQVALENGTSLGDCLGMVKSARAAGLTIPVVFMGYYNPFLQYGQAALLRDCIASGVDGFIIVDLPPEDGSSLVAGCDAAGLAFVPLVAPTTLDARFAAITATARGFVYIVSVMGVTGARSALPVDLPALVSRVKSAVNLPVAVGFGISTRAHVDAVAGCADGVVMGSAIVAALAEGGVAGVKELLRRVVP